MFYALLGQDIRLAFSGPLGLWLPFSTLREVFLLDLVPLRIFTDLIYTSFNSYHEPSRPLRCPWTLWLLREQISITTSFLIADIKYMHG